MYTCGPTVYAPAHIGNFRAFLTYDILKRVLSRIYGFNVQHVLNLTDVDDKIIKKCRSENKTLKQVTEKYTKIFKADLYNLNVIPADDYPLATSYIPEMVEMILKLKSVGKAYDDEDGWWFDVSEDDNYGKRLVNRKVEGKEEGAESADFALWKFEKPGIDVPTGLWDTELGRGRPGWHIECSAIAKKLLGEKIDLHAGGVDLTFPHHENEAAQCAGVDGGEGWCGCWVHNGFVNVGGEKMSKSLNNFKTLEGSCPTRNMKRAYRWLVVSSHYRGALTYTEESLEAAEGAVKRVDKLAKALDKVEVVGQSGGELGDVVEGARVKFYEAVSDDLKMPRAAAAMFDVVKAAEKEARKEGKDRDDVGLGFAKGVLLEFDEIFGIMYTPEAGEGEEGAEEGGGGEEAGEDVWNLVEARKAAKADKDWGEADRLRDEIKTMGWVVVDGKDGAQLEKV
ncbi:hypothetical protein TrST_g11996 [Triparma strigata]|uniref:cysteine--tRNA ligase n=1 Tax=Triparma strigata TaxID=1606541 RepID=A0A9W7AG71_9STRA|nr:hypothetical protein TrST_g11996 [Triparma strigata]